MIAMDRMASGAAAVTYRPEPVNRAFARILAGEDEWIALGDFLDDWYRATADQRRALIADPLPSAVGHGQREDRWEALLTAVVDWLCWISDPRVDPPKWVAEGGRLAEPWFVDPSNALRVWQLVHSPAPFRMRNIYTDESIVSRA